MNIFKPAALLFFSLVFSASPCLSAERQTAFVQEVLSGDTVRLKGGKVLRYASLEAPPLQHKIPLVRTYGENAKAFNESLVLNKPVEIEWGAKLRNAQNELLGFVFLKDGRFVNAEILKNGHAKPRIAPPNLAYAAELKEAAREGAKNRLGLWKDEIKNPYVQEVFYGEKNTKIYYLPDCEKLERIPQAQLVKFRSRVEASAAGYRVCPTCKAGAANADESQSLY